MRQHPGQDVDPQRQDHGVEGEREQRVHDVVPQFKIGQFHHQNALTFGLCLATGALPPASVAEGRAALLMILKAYAAAESGQRQQFG